MDDDSLVKIRPGARWLGYDLDTLAFINNDGWVESEFGRPVTSLQALGQLVEWVTWAINKHLVQQEKEYRDTLPWPYVTFTRYEQCEECKGFGTDHFQDCSSVLDPIPFDLHKKVEIDPDWGVKSLIVGRDSVAIINELSGAFTSAMGPPPWALPPILG